VVIIGGGVIGCSIAYHLARIGWSEVVLLAEQAAGTTRQLIQFRLQDPQPLYDPDNLRIRN
jgi:glycine/D-amino acid oxidase-like deaminating enzyme